MALDIQSRRRKAKDKDTLAKRLAKERKEKREKEREEKELSRVTGNPLTALAVERPNAPEIGEGVSLRSLTGNPAATVKPNSPPKDGGPIDWDAVAESNPGAKKPVVFIPPGSQKAEADKLLPGGEQGPVAPPEDNTIDQFADAAEEAGELADVDEAALQAAIESGNEGDQYDSPVNAEADASVEDYSEVNPVQAARAKRRSAEFWAQRMKAPVEEVMTVMDIAEQELLSENPDATPEEIKQAQLVALETDEDLAKHKEVHGGQIQAAVDRQADQTNRARIMGVPRGMVMMLDQINDAQTPDDIVKGLITASGVYPQFRPMLQNVITGQVSANALKSQLATAMMQMRSAENVARINAGARQKPDERTTVNILENFKTAAAEFTPQSVLAAKTYAAEMGQTEDLFNITALAFAEPMKSVAMKLLSPQGASDDEITTAKEVISLAMNGDRPQLNDINRLFGSTLSATQAEHIVRLLYGGAGVAATRTGGPARKWINDATGGRWEPVDAVNGAMEFIGAEGFPRVNEPR